MVEAELLTIGVLGLALVVAIWIIATNRGADEARINQIANTILLQQANELRKGNETELETMSGQVATAKDKGNKVEAENVEIKQLISGLQALQSSLENTQTQTNQAVDAANKEARRIVNALAGNDPIAKRDYGEGRVRTILEGMGLEDGVHFEEQYNLPPYPGHEKGTEPDFILMLPGGAAQAIDPKAVTKAAFRSFYELDDEVDIDEKKKHLKKHTTDVWNQVKDLADRNYPLGLHKHLGKEGPDFTIMFIPNDEFLVRAERGVTKEQKKSWGHDSLEEAAISRNVFLCSPYGLRILANYTMKLWRGVGQNKELNELLGLVQQVSEAVIETERSRDDHHNAMKELVRTWNKHIDRIESTDGRGKTSLRVAVDGLFRRVPSQMKSRERGKKGELAGAIPLSSDVAEPKSPAGISEIDTSARLIDGEEE
ncbi:MAG: DNA recombination protein RmuC [Candidatus Thermoplasmatota archaeon]|nr:DNA recombination protein RmuC [Candidatus Thermoplasmatota archaeon]